MAQNESPKPSAHTQQKESHGKEVKFVYKSSRDNNLKETITARKES